MEYIIEAFLIACTPLNLLALIGSTLLGLVCGMLPGLTSTMAVALLTGLSYGLPTQTALIVVISVYVGAISGGCQSAVLLNIPGTPASAATAQDGYPLAQQGKAGLAIFLATTSSFIATVISIICVAAFTPTLSAWALNFGVYEYFMLSFFGIVICGNLTAKENPLKGWIAGFVGLFIAQIGLESINAIPRFVYDNVSLRGGIQLIPVMIGLFGFPEILNAFQRSGKKEIGELEKFNPIEGLRIIKNNIFNIIRSSFIGVSVGIIPGVGEDIGGWLSYWATKSLSKDPDSFGTGNPAGIIAPEAGNNACVGGALIPVLSLAVPGSTSAAVLLAAFYLHGYLPGPLLYTDSPDFVYKLCVYMVLASFAMWALALIVSRFSVKILGIRAELLMPVILMLCVIGSYVVRSYKFDVYVMFVFGILGYLMVKMNYPAAPFMLGVILGNMFDSNLRRGLLLSDGSLLPFITRPISAAFLVAIVLMLLSQLGVFRKISAWRKAKKAAQTS